MKNSTANTTDNSENENETQKGNAEDERMAYRRAEVEMRRMRLVSESEREKNRRDGHRNKDRNKNRTEEKTKAIHPKEVEECGKNSVEQAKSIYAPAAIVAKEIEDENANLKNKWEEVEQGRGTVKEESIERVRGRYIEELKEKMMEMQFMIDSMEELLISSKFEDWSTFLPPPLPLQSEKCEGEGQANQDFMDFSLLGKERGKEKEKEEDYNYGDSIIQNKEMERETQISAKAHVEEKLYSFSEKEIKIYFILPQVNKAIMINKLKSQARSLEEKLALSFHMFSKSKESQREAYRKIEKMQSQHARDTETIEGLICEYQELVELYNTERDENRKLKYILRQEREENHTQLTETRKAMKLLIDVKEDVNCLDDLEESGEKSGKDMVEEARKEKKEKKVEKKKIKEIQVEDTVTHNTIPCNQDQERGDPDRKGAKHSLMKKDLDCIKESKSSNGGNEFLNVEKEINIHQIMEMELRQDCEEWQTKYETLQRQHLELRLKFDKLTK